MFHNVHELWTVDTQFLGNYTEFNVKVSNYLVVFFFIGWSACFFCHMFKKIFDNGVIYNITYYKNCS